MTHRDTQGYTVVQSTAHSSQRERRGQIALTRGCSAMMRAAVPRGWQPCFLNGGKVPSATKLFSNQRQGAVMTPNKLLFCGRSPSTIPACNSETCGNSLLSSFEASPAGNLQQCLRCFDCNFIELTQAEWNFVFHTCTHEYQKNHQIFLDFIHYHAYTFPCLPLACLMNIMPSLCENYPVALWAVKLEN